MLESEDDSHVMTITADDWGTCETTNREKNWPFNLQKVTKLIPYWSNSCHRLIPIQCTDTLALEQTKKTPV